MPWTHINLKQVKLGIAAQKARFSANPLLKQELPGDVDGNGVVARNSHPAGKIRIKRN